MHWATYFRMLQHVGMRYFFIAGIAFLIFYLVFKNQKKYRKLQPKFPKLKDYRREIGYSIISIAIFAAVPLFILHYPPIAPYTTYYKHIDDFGWLYFFLAFPIMFLIHDAYFYWTHRLMHTKRLFRIVHLVHHQSTNPSPWAAYAFHPIEGVVEAGVF